RWTFADARGHTSPLVRFLRFNLACTLGALINLALFVVLRRLGANLALANLGAIAASTLWNYLVNLRFNWRVGASPPNKSPQDRKKTGP
ncbi:MAG: GtrA family protein, partial [Pseudanabaenaceae cyanobacterium]